MNPCKRIDTAVFCLFPAVFKRRISNHSEVKTEAANWISQLGGRSTVIFLLIKYWEKHRRRVLGTSHTAWKERQTQAASPDKLASICLAALAQSVVATRSVETAFEIMSEPRISKETIGNSWGILLKRHFGSQVGLSSSESLKHGHRVY